MNRENYLLRQRNKTAKTGEETAETVDHLNSDEQEELVKSLTTEANNQGTFIAVRAHGQVFSPVKLR